MTHDDLRRPPLPTTRVPEPTCSTQFVEFPGVSQTASATVTINNRLGLHARPAMLFVETAGQWKSDITVSRPDTDLTIDGKSIMQLMMLAATQGTELTITASGEDAEDAVKGLSDLIESNFHEE